MEGGSDGHDSSGSNCFGCAAKMQATNAKEL
jgi:hypothetical protein